MYRITKEDLYVDSVVSENEANGKGIEFKILVDIDNENILEKFGEIIKEPTLVSYVTINKYNRTLICVNFELENPYFESKSIQTILSIQEQEVFRLFAVNEMKRLYYEKQR